MKSGDRPWILHLAQDKYSDLNKWERAGMRAIARLAKVLVQGVVPAGFLSVVYSVFSGGSWRLSRILMCLWGASEVVVYMYWQHRLRKRFQRKPSPLSLDDKVALTKRLLEHVDDMEDMLGKWMLHKEGKLDKEHICDWVVWMLFDKEASELTRAESLQAEAIFQSFGEKLFPNWDSDSNPNRTPNIPMRPSLDQMECFPKPVLGYIAIQISHLVGSVMLRFQGFRYYNVKGLGYWRLAGNSEMSPVLYIHGVGVGFPMYMDKLRAMRKQNLGREILLIELPHISMAPSEKILDHDQTLAAIDVIFQTHSLGKVSVAAHSFGSILASWLIQRRPNYVEKITLMDPVCFRIWDSTLARNFLYAEPFSFVHELMRFFVAMDPLITQTVSKELYWYESVLFPEDILVEASIFLSRDDWVVDAKECYRYLKGKLPPGSKVKLMETSHAGCLRSPKFYSEIIQSI